MPGEKPTRHLGATSTINLEKAHRIQIQHQSNPNTTKQLIVQISPITSMGIIILTTRESTIKPSTDLTQIKHITSNILPQTP